MKCVVNARLLQCIVSLRHAQQLSTSIEPTSVFDQQIHRIMPPARAVTILRCLVRCQNVPESALALWTQTRLYDYKEEPTNCQQNGDRKCVLDSAERDLPCLYKSTSHITIGFLTLWSSAHSFPREFCQFLGKVCKIPRLTVAFRLRLNFISSIMLRNFSYSVLALCYNIENHQFSRAIAECFARLGHGLSVHLYVRHTLALYQNGAS